MIVARTFRLLDRCASAVIDGSGVIAPGWVNEVEHIARDPIPTRKLSSSR
jgi:hypothetical protein